MTALAEKIAECNVYMEFSAHFPSAELNIHWKDTSKCGTIKEREYAPGESHRRSPANAGAVFATRSVISHGFADAAPIRLALRDNDSFEKEIPVVQKKTRICKVAGYPRHRGIRLRGQ